MTTNTHFYPAYPNLDGYSQTLIQPTSSQSHVYPPDYSASPQQHEIPTQLQSASPHYILSYTQYGMFPNPLMPPPQVSAYPLYEGHQYRITFSPETTQTTKIREQTAYLLPKDLPSSANVKVHFYGGSGKPEILDHSASVTVSDSCSRPHTPMHRFSSEECPNMGSNCTVEFGEPALTAHATKGQLPRTLRFVPFPVKEEGEQGILEEPDVDEETMDFQQNETSVLKSLQACSDNELSTNELDDESEDEGNEITLADWHHFFHGHITTLRHILANIPVSETLAIPSNCRFIEKLFIDIQKIGSFITQISGENRLSYEDITLEEKVINLVLLLGKANQDLILFAQLQADRCQELINAKLPGREIRIALDKIKLIQSIIDSTNNVLEFLKTKLY